MLSVIIPVYNTAQTLDACVESVLQQQIDEMQLLLVDDASPDEAPARCDAWAARHPQRIRVIHQPKNGGLSAARNAALDLILRYCSLHALTPGPLNTLSVLRSLFR